MIHEAELDSKQDDKNGNMNVPLIIWFVSKRTVSSENGQARWK
jgi:hypothetical protein